MATRLATTDLDERQTCIGYCVFLSGAAVFWLTRFWKPCLSTFEGELGALTEVANTTIAAENCYLPSLYRGLSKTMIHSPLSISMRQRRSKPWTTQSTIPDPNTGRPLSPGPVTFELRLFRVMTILRISWSKLTPRRFIDTIFVA